MTPARYHVAAHAELRSAVTHDEAERPGRGVDLEAQVRRVVRRVQFLPRSAPRWPLADASLEVRRAKVSRHPYVVVYAVLPDQIVVLAVAHTSKRPDYWRDRVP